MKTAIVAPVVLLALAGTAFAQRDTSGLVNSIYSSNGMVSAGRPADFRGVPGQIIAEYNFATGAMNVAFPGSDEIVVNPALANLEILAIEAIGIEATVYHNLGAAFENWASELRVGLLFDDEGDAVALGAQPFFGINTGPEGGQGSTRVYTGGAYGPISLAGTAFEGITTPASGFVVSGFTSYNDGTGLTSHTVTGGIFRVYLVPAPGAGALLAMAGVVAARRRRA